MGGSSTMQVLIALGVIGLFGIITFALTAASLGTLNKRDNALRDQIDALQKQISNLNNLLTPTTTLPANSTTTISSQTNEAVSTTASATMGTGETGQTHLSSGSNPTINTSPTVDTTTNPNTMPTSS